MVAVRVRTPVLVVRDLNQQDQREIPDSRNKWEVESSRGRKDEEGHSVKVERASSSAMPTYRCVARLAEQWTLNPEGAGSTPVTPTHDAY